MRVDDVGERAGAELRDRFAGEYAPALPWELGASPARRTYMSRFVLVLAGLMVVALATSLTLVALDARTPTQSDRGGEMWQRVSFDQAFGRNASVRSPVATRAGFVAVGTISHPENFDLVGATTSPAIWKSRNGSSWSRVRTHGLPSSAPEQFGPSGIVLSGSQFVLTWNAGPRLMVYLSSNLADWKRVAVIRHVFSFDLQPSGRGFLLSVRSSNGLAVDAYRGYQAKDGRNWRRVQPSSQPNVLTGLPPGSRVNGRYIARALDDQDRPAIYGSADGLHWTLITTAISEHFLGWMAADRDHRRLFGIQYEPSPETPGGRLLWTRDGRTWQEVASFHERFPAGNPDHLVQSGSWWILGGYRGARVGTARAGNHRQSTLWASPDLKHWIELPPALRGPVAHESKVAVIARGGTVLATSSGGFGRPRFLWIWHRPARTPQLVRVSGTWRGVGGDAPGLPRRLPGRVEVKALDGKLIDSSETDTEGRFVLDLEPGRYVLDGPCDRTTVRVGRQPIHRDVLCQMK